jgi:DNA-binding NarL/FixJ family response regulator
MPMKKIRVMLVDDQMLLREGLKTIINIQEDMEVAAEAENGQRALACLEKTAVDVILMDIQMPVMNGVEATAAIKKSYPGTAIIILTTFDNDDFIIDALTNGAVGYLLKDINGPHLIRAIRDAHEGQLMLPGRIAAKLAARISGQKAAPARPLKEEGLSSLNEREREIGALLAQGLSNRQIAKNLFLSEGTVKNYISEIYSKLGTSNRTQAGLLLQQLNIE